MTTNNDFITFECASIYTGINKYTLGRVKSGYLSNYIKDNQFNIKKYNEDVKSIKDTRHLVHCVYYAISDIYITDEELSKYLGKLCGKSKNSWFNFLDIELFSIDKNNLLLNWYEKKMISEVYEEVLTLNEEGKVDWEFYYY